VVNKLAEIRELMLARSRNSARFTRFACLAAIAGICLTGGCVSYPPHTAFAGKPIAFPGGGAYANRSASFKLTLDEAYRVAESAAKAREGMIVNPEPMFIVDRFYAFGVRSAWVIPLTGVYVNGDTGVYKYVETSSVIALYAIPHIAR